MGQRTTWNVQFSPERSLARVYASSIFCAIWVRRVRGVRTRTEQHADLLGIIDFNQKRVAVKPVLTQRFEHQVIVASALSTPSLNVMGVYPVTNFLCVPVMKK